MNSSDNIKQAREQFAKMGIAPAAAFDKYLANELVILLEQREAEDDDDAIEEQASALEYDTYNYFKSKILEWLQRTKPAFITLADIVGRDCLNIASDASDYTRVISACMKELGFKRVRQGGKRGWVKKEQPPCK